MAASVWTGYLTFGLISMPVRLYSGARGSRVGFHMLHRQDHVRLKQQLICPAEDRPVGRDEVVKGFEYSKGEYVIIEPDEIKKIEPKTAKAMEILEFVKADEVDPVFFESSYYLMPEEAGKRPYSLLAKVMGDSGFLAVAKLTMHNREYMVLLRPHRNGLMLHTMFYQDEVRQVEHFGEAATDLREGEIKVAQQLIEALAGKWDPSKYRDTFEDNLRRLIQARLEGREVSAVEKPRRPVPVVDLMDALKQSLEQMQTRKPPERVAEAQASSETVAVEHGHAPRKRAPAKRAKRAA